jgi:hypothetical protein
MRLARQALPLNATYMLLIKWYSSPSAKCSQSCHMMTVLSCMTLMIGTTQATASIKQRQYANAGCKSADASWLAAAYYTLAENILAIEVYHSSLNACDGTTECKDTHCCSSAAHQAVFKQKCSTHISLLCKMMQCTAGQYTYIYI